MTVRIDATGNSNHGKCQDGNNCSGPGCRVTTGKTKEDHQPAAKRERVKRAADRLSESSPTDDTRDGSEALKTAHRAADAIARIHSAPRSGIVTMEGI